MTRTRDVAGASWRTSSYSTGGNQCVEVGPTPTLVGVRDTKHRSTGTLTVPVAAWSAFISSVKNR